MNPPPGPLGRPTLDAVAARAGVGRGTASRVVNGSAQVSPKARAAVQQAIAELGYVPNRAARALVTRRTDTVALVVSESPERSFTEPFLASVVRGVSAGLLDTRRQLWLAMVRSAAERERFEHQLTGQHVDGVLLLSADDADPLPARLDQLNLPVVRGGRTTRMLRSSDRPGYVVDTDDASGARQAVGYLRDRGRRRIATIAGPQDTAAGMARLDGYREAVDARDDPVSGGLIGYGDSGAESGELAMRLLLHRRPDLDAVFAASDAMACGALRALRAAGRRVPEEVAVIGFGDDPIARQIDPPLTTVRQPVQKMGRQLTRLLVNRIRRDDPPPYVLLDTQLVRRGSA